jgi:hypothetical protein
VGPIQPPVQWVPGVLSPGIKRGWGVMLTTHPHLVPRLRISRSYTSSPPQAPPWRVAGSLYRLLTTLTMQVFWYLVNIFNPAGLHSIIKIHAGRTENLCLSRSYTRASSKIIHLTRTKVLGERVADICRLWKQKWYKMVRRKTVGWEGEWVSDTLSNKQRRLISCHALPSPTLSWITSHFSQDYTPVSASMHRK